MRPSTAIPRKGARQGDGSAERPWRTIEEVLAARLIQLCDEDGKPANPGRAGQARRHGAAPLRLARRDPHRRRLQRPAITIAADKGHTPQVGWIEIGEGRKWLVRGLTVSPSLAPSRAGPAAATTW